MNRDFRELLSAFNDHKVKYLIVGGYAVSYHSEPRTTKDLGLFIQSSPENAKAVFQALSEYFDAAWANRERGPIIAGDPFEADYISARDLIRNKLAIGRPRDIADAEDIQAALKATGRVDS